ncbi:hypothetical protein [Paenibacillus sp. 1P07SE]|uniref:hypothetical protein n=1 Tax=Paenibacillus sp. 1P07SE TaxID=3132209 RepID=UPI0039A61923
MNAIAAQLDHQIQIRYRRWLHADLPGYLRKELSELKAGEMTDRFYRHLVIGTEGIRERVGVGSNRVNIYTIRRIARALADELSAGGERLRRRGVVIGFDGRLSSRGFAQQAAQVLAHCGIRAYLLEQSRPTPQLSYAVRWLEAAAGIVITAGHYPREYNGCKLYGEDGSPLTQEASAALASRLDTLEDELGIPLMNQQDALEKELLVLVGKELDQAYQRNLAASVPLAKISKNKAAAVRIVVTALHGTGGEALRRMLARAKYTDVTEVVEQAGPDPFFSAVPHPDPSRPEALEPAIRLARSVQADVVLAMDPEAQRLTLTIRESGGGYRTLQPDETGALLLEYVCMQLKRLDKSAATGSIYTSVLTGGLADSIAKRYGMELSRTLPGFRHIASAMASREALELQLAVQPWPGSAASRRAELPIAGEPVLHEAPASSGQRRLAPQPQPGAVVRALRQQVLPAGPAPGAPGQAGRLPIAAPSAAAERGSGQAAALGGARLGRMAGARAEQTAAPASGRSASAAPSAESATPPAQPAPAPSSSGPLGPAGAPASAPASAGWASSAPAVPSPGLAAVAPASVPVSVAADAEPATPPAQPAPAASSGGPLGPAGAPASAPASAGLASSAPVAPSPGRAAAAPARVPVPAAAGAEPAPAAPPPFRFAYDENGGYLPADFVRDKDALQTAMLIAEMTAYYKGKKLTLANRLQQIYEQYGHHLEDQVSLAYKGLEGWQRIRNAMEKLRAEPPLSLGALQVSAVCDYGTGEIRHRQSGRVEPTGLPAGEIIKYQLEGGAWCAVRASSAEPVLTLYYGCRAETAAASRRLAAAIRSSLLVAIESIL